MDPLEQAKQKMANGQPLTRDEAMVISNAGVTSSDIAAVKNPPPAQPSVTQKAGYSLGPTKKPPLIQPQGNVIPTPQNPENVALAQTIQKAVGDAPETYQQWMQRLGRTGSPADAKEYNANLKSLVPQASPAPAVAATPIPSTPIQPVTSVAKTAPPPVVSGPIKSASPNGAPALDTPVTPEQAKGAVNAMDQFLKSNPDGMTLANILDAVGVTLSARGGVQRQTMLSKRKDAQMQYAQAAGLKAMDLDNQSKLLQVQLQNAMAQNNQQAVLELKNRLQEIEAQKNANIEQTKAVAGVNGLAGVGGIPGLVNKYAGVGQ